MYSLYAERYNFLTEQILYIRPYPFAAAPFSPRPVVDMANLLLVHKYSTHVYQRTRSWPICNPWSRNWPSKTELQGCKPVCVCGVLSFYVDVVNCVCIFMCIYVYSLTQSQRSLDMLQLLIGSIVGTTTCKYSRNG